MKWKECRNILCVRADNMGDVIMSTPAFRALKETLKCKITLLTSTMGSGITSFIKEVDETIVFDLPWIKSNAVQSKNCIELIEKLKSYNFDGAIIFTVYSQSALPAAMLAYMANIPLRLAYCRENPYELLTDWVADKEPYSFILHQVERDLNLVKTIGAVTINKHLSLQFNTSAFKTAIEKLRSAGFDENKNFIIAHPGVSESKREYPEKLWAEVLNIIKQYSNTQILLTGVKNEYSLTQSIQQKTGENIFAVAGLLNIEEFIAVIARAELIISVNTATIHIAAALNKPVIVLYALTNPQHTPWLTKNVVLQYSVPEKLKSKNEIIRFVNESYFNKQIEYPPAFTVAENALKLLNKKETKPLTKTIISN